MNGQGHLIFDQHELALKANISGTMATFLALAGYASYYYWYLVPFNSLYFGISAAATTLLSAMSFTGKVALSLTAYEIVLMPDKEHVRIGLVNGHVILAKIADMKYLKD
jgi:L-alanine-DL-glutamate epimerase-like enolase superfamily enzyme